MKKLFRPRNLLILFGIGIVVGIVLSKKNQAPAPSYPDPWASPKPADTGDGEATEASNASSNGSSESADSESTAGA